jgi:hypothetical protein
MTPSLPSLSPNLMTERSLNNLARGLVIVGLLVLFLSVGREFLEPLVIAALLSFILAPVIRFLRGIGIWRTPAVVITVIAALAALAAIGSTLVVQITQLAIELPRYESTLRAKAQQIGGASLASSALERAARAWRRNRQERCASWRHPVTADKGNAAKSSSRRRLLFNRFPTLCNRFCRRWRQAVWSFFFSYSSY